jgi:predicted small lipoprotein YifL
MRFPLTLASAILLAACGQTGSLYLPDEGVETPVEIRSPAPATAAPAPVPEPDEDEQNPKDAPPPG